VFSTHFSAATVQVRQTFAAAAAARKQHTVAPELASEDEWLFNKGAHRWIGRKVR
jgi:hypothetical protein